MCIDLEKWCDSVRVPSKQGMVTVPLLQREDITRTIKEAAVRWRERKEHESKLAQMERYSKKPLVTTIE
jgi:hypothetical protein